jgi:hypothetical protein
MDLYGLSLISIVFHRFGRFWGQDVWRLVAACAALWQPVAADWIPLYIKISDPGGLDLKVWCLDAWMLKD